MNRDYRTARYLFPFCSMLFVCFGLGLEARAQVTPLDAPAFSVSPKNLSQAAAEAPLQKNAQIMILLDEERDTIEADGRARQVTHMIYRVDTQSGVENWASISAAYWPWYQTKPMLRARVITPGDGVQHDLDPKSLSDHALKDHDENVFSDEHVFEGPLPAVTIGSVIEVETVLEDKIPFFQKAWSTSYVIGRNQPVLRTRLVVDAPDSLPLRYKTLLAPELKVLKSEREGTTTYRFEYGRTEPLESDPMLPPDVPRYPGILLTTANNWSDLATQYWKRSEPQIRPEEVKALVAGVHGDEKSTIAQLLMKVHESARYTGLEFGESNITPQPPSETLKRKYGDCKDKATLLVSMLRAAGIQAQIALLNSGTGRDMDPDLPGMGHFNHAIVYVPSQDLFIDATSEYSRVGELPSEDQNRWALVIAENTTQLKHTPQLPSSTNRTVEKREFFLQDYGPARVTEQTTWYGDRESSYRSSFGGGDGKGYKKKLDEYVQNEYLADGVSKYEHTEARNLQEPFSLHLEIPKAKRGNMGVTDAVAAIRLIDMVSEHIPEELKKEVKADDAASSEGNDKESKPRTSDWYLGEVSQAEWQYRVNPPAGFHVRALPEKKAINFGPALLTEEFKEASDGAIEAMIRFDLVKRSYSVVEAAELRKALKQFHENGVQSIYFDLTANTYMGQGKVREALAEYRKLVADHPKEAIHRARLATAYLTASLGESARAEAREAVKLDPKSAVAYDTLGWILLHDSVGRKFTKGFDPVGAADAYRRAKELDPKDPSYALSLGEALEYDASGERYVGVKLDEAINVYRELKKNEQADASSVNEHLLYALAYARRFKEVRDALSELGDVPLTRSMKVLLVAGTDGSNAAITRAAEIAKDEKSKSDALVNAGALAMRIRMYPEAAALMAAGADGQPNASAVANLAQLLARTTMHEQMKRIDGDPVNLCLRALVLGIHPERRGDLAKLMSRASGELPHDYRAEILKNHWSIRYPGDLPQKVYMDLTLALLKTSVEGDDANGYRVTWQSPGTAAQHLFIVKEEGELRLLSENADLSPLGQEVLDRIARNDLKGAKTLLDWARDERKLAGGEDPYAGAWFARSWSKSDVATPDAMRVAATVLIASAPDAVKPYIPELESARAKAATDAERARLDEALASAYRNVRDWPKLEQVVSTMLSRTNSPTLFQILATCKARQNKWEELAKLIEQQRGKLDDEYAIAITEARADLLQRQSAKAIDVLKSLIDSGKGNESAINLYGWAAVITGEIKPDVLNMVQQAVQQPSNQNYGILHTLGCMYAVAGRPAQAQQVLLDAMKRDKSIDAPESSIWYGFGLLAESYGERDAAIRLYAMVERPKYDQPEEDSTYVLAQHRLKGMGQPGN